MLDLTLLGSAQQVQRLGLEHATQYIEKMGDFMIICVRVIHHKHQRPPMKLQISFSH